MVKQDDPISTFSSQVKRTVGISAYMVRFDDDGTYTYIGNANPGSSTGASVWQVKRIKNTNGDIDWADGNLKFDNEWDEVRNLSYS